MKKRLSLLTTHLRVGIAEDESHRGEEVGLARSISADNDIVLRRERLDIGLLLVAMLLLAHVPQNYRGASRIAGLWDSPLEALDADLLDIHDRHEQPTRLSDQTWYSVAKLSLRSVQQCSFSSW